MSARTIRVGGMGLLAVLLCVGVVLAGGCAAKARVAKPVTTQPAVTTTPPAATTQTSTPGGAGTSPMGATPTAPPAASKPGTFKATGGQSRVVGTLQQRNIEGGIWVVVDALPSAATAKSKVLCVISDPELFDMASLKSAYVEVIGTITPGGASANQAGPEMIAHSLVKAPVS